MAKKFFKKYCDELRMNTVYNPQMSNKWLGKEHRVKKRKGCPQIYQRLIVAGNGDVMPCCVDFQKKLNLGNVHKETLANIYRRRVGAIRKAHEGHKGRSLPACESCDNFALSSKVEGKVVYS